MPTTVPGTRPADDCNEDQQDCGVETQAPEEYDTITGQNISRNPVGVFHSDQGMIVSDRVKLYYLWGKQAGFCTPVTLSQTWQDDCLTVNIM